MIGIVGKTANRFCPTTFLPSDRVARALALSGESRMALDKCDSESGNPILHISH